MEVRYHIDGLNAPDTDLDVRGSVYFIGNPYSHYYSLQMVIIEKEQLCLYFGTTESLPENLHAQQHSIKLRPKAGKVGLVVRSIETRGDCNDVVYDMVTSEQSANGKHCFRYRRYEAAIERPRHCNLSLNVSDAYLKSQDFIVTHDEVFSGNPIEVFVRWRPSC
ncbi:hypothetical protein IJ102_00205 [Candidatus Saccharibacteria bacterium]|nr:hypothetical protein [Candidatus Saccharibacteria bacterium]